MSELSDEGKDSWTVPPGLTPEQRLDWEQARAIDTFARAVRHLERRLEAIEKLIESVVKPVIEESVAWAATRRSVLEAMWNSGLGPVKTGPTMVFIAVVVVISVGARQCGVDPIKLSQEGRGWWHGDCVDNGP